MIKQYGPEYWDKYGVYRAPIAFNLSLLVLLRPFLIWVLVAVSRQPELDLMSIFYHSKHDFFIAMGIASGALISAVVYSFRRPSSSPKIATLWRFMRYPMVLTACLDLGWLLWKAQLSYYQFSGFIAVQLVMVAWVILYLLKSQYLAYFFNDWPEHEPPKK